MADKHFTHLHLHSEFSLLDGAIKLDKLVKFGKENDFKALAITDHGNIFGAVKFFQLCKKEKIKPILGIESYFCEDVKQKSVDKKYYHLILIVQNAVGYKNLCKLISYSYQQGFYFKPRIDYQMLEKHHEGLIATTACLGGHIPQLLMNNEQAEAQHRLEWFNTVFKDRFYLEVQPDDQHDQTILNDKLFTIAKEQGIPLLATGDCHYLTAEDRQAHEVMLCIQTQHKLTDPERFTFGDCRVHVRTKDQMLELFKDHEDAVWNSGKIADQCDFDFETNKLFFPKFAIPETHTPDSYFRELAEQGLKKLIDGKLIEMDKEQIYWDRLKEETELIINMGFVGYFLVVSHFIQWAKRNQIPVGPGRGSAAGSLVAWALEITNLDPLKYNLLFERFLNPERVSMPDIDIDFCIEGREKVINFVRDYYGHEKVGQIITFGTMMAKGVIKDVARVLGLPFEDSNNITSLIPDQLKISLKDALEQEPQLKELINSNPQVQNIFDIAFRLEGITRHASKHAAGIVISPEPIDEVLPVYVPPKSTELVTQYAMSELEAIGFLKIDLLGLKNLTLIDRCIKMIKQNHNVIVDMDRLPLDDQKTLALVAHGKTSGVFQFESNGIKDVLIKLQPTKFEDMIAVNALYRPGPLGSGMVEDFIERKHGRQKVTYLFDELKPILEETYGVIVYQEQVMKIASTIGGYSLGQSDILRRAMGKKKAEVMAEQREIFLTKSIERGFDGTKAGELFDLMAYFAGYGFNKSHSAAYALIAYQTAYLKAHYPAEFMACLISLESSDAEKMAFYLHEAKEMGIEILPPDINRSEIGFTVDHGKIIFGLQGIKNVGLAALENIIAEREKAPFIEMLNFCKRIDLRTSNKRVIESLICAGAFDTLPGHRSQQFEELPHIIDRAIEIKRAEETGQMDLFGIINTSSEPEQYVFDPLPEWDNKTKLEKELEVIGFYLSAHPLDAYKSQQQLLQLSTFSAILEQGMNVNSLQDPIVAGFGLLQNIKTIITKKGDKMAFIALEDRFSSAEIVLFPKTYTQVETWLKEYTVFIVKGRLDLTATQKCKIIADQLVPADLFFEKWNNIQAVALTIDELHPQLLKTIQQELPKGPIPLHITFNENDKKLRIQTKHKVALTTEFMQSINRHKLPLHIII